MNAKFTGRLQKGVELIASASLAGAVGFAAYAMLPAVLSRAQANVLAITAAIAAFLIASLILRQGAKAKPSIRTAAFEVVEFEPCDVRELSLADEGPAESEELVLGEADRLDRPDSEALELDDVLAAIGPDSRVVRLFDRKAMPTPGQLQTQIDEHLVQRMPVPARDASQALSDALAELRRSLR